MLRDGSNLFLGGHADFCQCDRQSDLQAEVLHFIKFLLGRALQNELYQSTESDTAAVIRVRDAERGNAVIEGVRGSAVDIIRADTGEIDVRFHDGLQRRCDSMHLAGLHSLLAVRAKRVIAELCQCLSCACNTGSLQTCRFGSDGRAPLKEGAERVSHAGDQEFDRGVGDDNGVNQNCVRVRRVEQVFIKAVVIVVDDGQTGTWRIGSGNRRNDNDMLAGIEGSRFGGIYRAAAANRDDRINLVFFYDGFHLINLAVAGDTAKNFIAAIILTLSKAFL